MLLWERRLLQGLENWGRDIDCLEQQRNKIELGQDYYYLNTDWGPRNNFGLGLR